jgi:FkbM family methyltransferase
MTLWKKNMKPDRIVSDLIAYAILLKEGYNTRDKLAILRYFLMSPLRFYYKALGREFTRRLPVDVKIKNASGIFFCGRSLNSCRIASSYHEKNIQNHIRLQRGVFIDVGAHIGKYTVPVARMLGNKGTVISVEPEPENFSILNKNLSLNNLDNVHPFQVACSQEDGETTLYVDKIATTLHSIHADETARDRRSIIVRTFTLDTIVRNLELARVDLIKIDTEGAELEVIQGSNHILQKYHPRIVFEAWSRMYLDKIAGLLSPFGYKVAPIDRTNYVAY